MEAMENNNISHLQKKWEQMKIEAAKKKLKSLWKKYNLDIINPGLKEYEMSASHYDDLRSAFDKFMKLYSESMGRSYDPNGTMAYKGPHGLIRIKKRKE